MHVWYLSDAHVKVLIVDSAGDGLRAVELGLLDCQSQRPVSMRITVHLRWNLPPCCQMYRACLTILVKLRNVENDLNNTTLTLYDDYHWQNNNKNKGK